jgi:hypothetical protein
MIVELDHHQLEHLKKKKTFIEVLIFNEKIIIIIIIRKFYLSSNTIFFLKNLFMLNRVKFKDASFQVSLIFSQICDMCNLKGEDPLPLRSSHSLQFLVRIMTCDT